MSFNLPQITRALDEKGAVIRVLILSVKGSTPREAGTSMLVWDGGQSGTIGGGALEFEVTKRATEMLRGSEASWVLTLPLGPSLGQCCGGAVTLLLERFTPLTAPKTLPYVRPLPGTTNNKPAALETGAEFSLAGGWVSEAAQPQTPVWIWGAGHVGRAIVSVLAPLPNLDLTWIDRAPERFPDVPPNGVTCVPTASVAAMCAYAPRDAMHLILTYSHEIDLALCDGLLERGFSYCGLIGSATKWARFRTRLQASGHTDSDTARIDCPIGDPAIGKHPQAIAIGVAAELMRLTLAAEEEGTLDRFSA